MIYEGHAYCFEDQRGRCGWSDIIQFRRHRQMAVAGVRPPAWRVRDRATADNSGLIDLSLPTSGTSAGRGFAALKECNFRAAGYGRWEWTVDGEDYAKQVYPPSIEDMAYPPERLIAEMDYAGIDWAMLHRTPYQGIGNEFHAACVMRYPDRLQALAHVEEWLVATEPDKSIAKAERAIKELRLQGLQFLPPQLNLYGQTGPWDGPDFLPFWDAVTKLDIPVFFSLNPRTPPAYESYIEELRTLRRWMERYPHVTVVLTHGMNYLMFAKEDRIEIPDEVYATAPIESPNFHVQLLFDISLGGKWDYPMPQMHSCLEQMAERIGTDKLIYGTDMPLVMIHRTLRQTIEQIRSYCDFLSQEDKDLILGGNMARIMKLDAV